MPGVKENAEHTPLLLYYVAYKRSSGYRELRIGSTRPRDDGKKLAWLTGRSRKATGVNLKGLGGYGSAVWLRTDGARGEAKVERSMGAVAHGRPGHESWTRRPRELT